MCTVLRTIYPIGQGGFISEYHHTTDKLIVYDCGSVTKNAYTRFSDLIKNELPGHDVDILFISHFDDDHVNQISTLKSLRKIKNVVIPLVHNNNLLAFFSKNQDAIRLLQNPEVFFGEQTKVIRISEVNRTEIGQPFEVEEINSDIVESLRPIVFNYQWEYIPFNVQNKTRSTQFQNECQSLQIDTTQLTDLTYIEENQAKIKQAYKKVKGGINANSLLLYSGAINTSQSEFFFNNVLCSSQCRRYKCCPCGNCNKEACLYTGDWDCSWISEFGQAFAQRINRIVLIQIPHHGSKHNFNQALIVNRNLHWFVQFGINNRYRHPSQMVFAILRNNGNNCIHCITEMDTMAMWQIINCQ